MRTNSTAQRLLPHLRRVVLARDTETGDGQLLGAFVASRDEAAFAALVRRHGPMVLGVCRRVVGDPHLAEDAFQATFLVLARRAAVIRPRRLVGHWLYGVAYRTALKARSAAARRKAKEKQVDAMPQPPVSADQVWTDLQPVIDAELALLPEKYRVPIVLCDLNGRPQRDVARELKLPAATLANRLNAARRLLARRLTVRGVALSAGAVAAALGWHAATSAVSPALASATVKAACAVAAGTAVGLPVPVIQLSEGVMRMFVVSKLKAVAAGAVSCVLLFVGLGLIAGPPLSANPDEKPARPTEAKTDRKSADPQRAVDNDDLTFLRRRSLDLRGTLPTPLEAHYFLADKDERKRAKVIAWMLDEHGGQKVTAQCASCHTVNTANELAARLAQIGERSDPHAGWAAWFVKQPDPKEDSAKWEVQIVVDQSRSALITSQLDLQIAESDSKARQDDPATYQARVDKAKAAVTAAQTQLKLAEAQLAELESTTRFAAWTSRRRLNDPEGQTRSYDELLRTYYRVLRAKDGTSDLEFLRRVSQDIRGVAPTKVEENYFLADKDPKKREKLLEYLVGRSKGSTGRDKLIDELLADPEVQKRWTVLWKERLAAERRDADERKAHEKWLKTPADRLARLLGELLNGKRTDDQVLEALCLATLARFPTDTEKKLILDGLKGQPDRRAAWEVVLAALATTQEARTHAESLSKRGQSK
jgi:RNA polymerase sigma factor (sigma-70 family)